MPGERSDLPKHVWLFDESTTSRKPPMIALLLEWRRVERDGPTEGHWRGLVAVAYPGGGVRVWWERSEVLRPYEAWPAPA